MRATCSAWREKLGAPVVEILGFNLAGPVLAVWSLCHNQDYWQVYFATNRVIQEVCATAHYPAPSTHQVILHRSLKESA